MSLFSIFSNKNTLYYPGCFAYFEYKEHYENYKKIFDKLGIKYKEIDKKICCGLPALEGGYEQELRKIARRNFEILKEENINEIITPCPGCYKSFKEDYKDVLPEWNIDIKNIWQIILEKLQEKDYLITKSMELATYSDSCYLGRYSNIYAEPRKILELLGYNLKELYNNKEEGFCCGSCGLLPLTNPELADKIAKEKLLQAKRLGINKIIVCSLQEYQLLDKNIKASKDFNNLEVLELSSALSSSLGLLSKEEKELYPRLTDDQDNNGDENE